MKKMSKKVFTNTIYCGNIIRGNKIFKFDAETSARCIIPQSKCFANCVLPFRRDFIFADTDSEEVMERLKANLMDGESVHRTLKRIAHEIIEKNGGIGDICLVGIRRRGLPLAKIIARNIKTIENIEPPVGALDITLYRDDLTEQNGEPTVTSTDIPFDINGKTVILVDDVLYTGRTARAALDATISLGRPARIQLAVLIDRGHRELPIRGDYVGRNIPTSQNEIIAVAVPPYDEETGVKLFEKCE